MYLKGTLKIDNDGNYTIEFNTGGESGNFDIGWNSILKDNIPVPIPAGQISDSNIYPYFSLKEPLIYYNNVFLSDFYFENTPDSILSTGQNKDNWKDKKWNPCTGYTVTSDSWFPSVNYQKDSNWKDYKCTCNYSGTYHDGLYSHKFTHNSLCEKRYVLLALEAYEDYDIVFENDYLLFYISKGKPEESVYKTFLDKLFTSGEHEFTFINSITHYNDDDFHHTSKIPGTINKTVTITKGEILFFENSGELNNTLFSSYYEGNIYSDYLYGNTKYGEWYPSKSIELNNFANFNLILKFNNGDTLLENDILNINYSQKYSYCYHNMYITKWYNKRIYHPAVIHFDYNIYLL